MKKIPRNNTRAIFEGLARRLSKKCFDQMRNLTELCLKDFTKIFEGVKISRLINATTFVYNMENFVFKVKPSTYYFLLKTKILADFQICISVYL